MGKITKQLVLLKEEKCDMERELEELRQNHRELRHKHDKLLNDSTGMVTQEKHIQELSDVKKWVFALKFTLLPLHSSGYKS